MLHSKIAALFLLLNAPVLESQGFEAASIKLSKDQRPGGMEYLPGGRFRATQMPMLIVIATAYNVPYSLPETLRIKNMPAWAITTRYDIEATPEKAEGPDSPVTTRNEKIRGLLRAVLADRLKLAIHREVEEKPIYALTAMSHGAHLEKAKIAAQDCVASAPTGTGGCHQIIGGMGRGLHGDAVDMADVALYASNWSDRPIIDQTGLTGLFSIQTEAWGAPILADSDRPSLFDIFERLGLQLVSRKGPVEFFVIDHIEKPTEN
jgi:uncharacterized protein (TIGR03435 family)